MEVGGRCDQARPCTFGTTPKVSSSIGGHKEKGVGCGGKCLKARSLMMPIGSVFGGVRCGWRRRADTAKEESKCSLSRGLMQRTWRVAWENLSLQQRRKCEGESSAMSRADFKAELACARRVKSRRAIQQPSTNVQESSRGQISMPIEPSISPQPSRISRPTDELICMFKRRGTSMQRRQGSGNSSAARNLVEGKSACSLFRGLTSPTNSNPLIGTRGLSGLKSRDVEIPMAGMGGKGRRKRRGKESKKQWESARKERKEAAESRVHGRSGFGAVLTAKSAESRTVLHIAELLQLGMGHAAWTTLKARWKLLWPPKLYRGLIGNKSRSREPGWGRRKYGENQSIVFLARTAVLDQVSQAQSPELEREIPPSSTLSLSLMRPGAGKLDNGMEAAAVDMGTIQPTPEVDVVGNLLLSELAPALSPRNGSRDWDRQWQNGAGGHCAKEMGYPQLSQCTDKPLLPPRFLYPNIHPASHRRRRGHSERTMGVCWDLAHWCLQACTQNIDLTRDDGVVRVVTSRMSREMLGSNMLLAQRLPISHITTARSMRKAMVLSSEAEETIQSRDCFRQQCSQIWMQGESTGDEGDMRGLQNMIEESQTHPIE
ncbi:hypothetical protein B0H17DRAFT_1133601 [Mycena rosella]|uniref:Uncharacterized protein n=1 Tax=Mycena rosella TaxID=1033263 RepID=A0AAD7DHE6_MYCRO|nr:hypothetical protein B0H17DRAFT_1133601 [Mycena rosella]